MNTQTTRFGSLQPVYAHNGEILAEIATFTSNGRAHQHDKWELCTVIRGKGRIITSQGHDHSNHINKVKKGSEIKIPPNTDHWMEVDEDEEMVISIVYVDHR